MRRPVGRILVALTLAVGGAGGGAAAVAGEDPVPVAPPAECGPGSAPETAEQGRVPLEDHVSGRADEPYRCNAELVASITGSAGFKVLRYVDAAGNECAYYDTAIVFPVDLLDPSRESLGVWVVDMADPTSPHVVDRLVTPAMLSPHESLVLNQERGVLAAVMGNPATYPGVVDLYDVSEDCRTPRLLSSSPIGFLGHEAGFSPDGRTLYAASLFTNTVAAIDVDDPTVPQLLTVLPISSHGITVNADGDRAYLSSLFTDGPYQGSAGLTILDVSAIDAREPLPNAEVVTTLTWPEVSTPQVAIPVTIDGRSYLVEVDEYAGSFNPVEFLDLPGVDPTDPGGLLDDTAFSTSSQVGAARIIDIEDEAAPRIVSNLRLEVHDPQVRGGVAADDPGAGFPGYTAHYCAVPRPVDPEIVACAMIRSGLQVFDIRDPHAPREIAYYNAPADPASVDFGERGFGTSYAMAAPAFAPERGEVWYADAASGFHVLRLTNGVWGPDPDPAAVTAPPARLGAGTPPPVEPAPVSSRPGLPATGGAWGAVTVGLVLLLAISVVGRRRRA